MRPLLDTIGRVVVLAGVESTTVTQGVERSGLDAPIDDLLITVPPKEGYTQFVVVGPRATGSKCGFRRIVIAKIGAS